MIRRPPVPSGLRFFCALLLASLPPVLALAGCGGAAERGPEPLPPRSNILLITIDTLRADHLSSYGYRRETSPVLDGLAAGGIRFDQATVQWPKTTPSFASMFTATYPKDNGIVRKVGEVIPCGFRMLAEELAARGYGTYAVVSNAAVGSDFHFDQGFDRFLETWKVGGTADGVDPNGAARVTRLTEGLLPQIDRSKPFFLWVHYLDPHFPYAPPEPARDRFQGDASFDPSTKVNISWDKDTQQMWGIGRTQVLDGHDDLAFYVARYDAEIAYADREIGDLLDALRRGGFLDRTLTLVTADHGESLGDHAYFFDHGRFGFNACLRVPLIVSYPGVLKPAVDRDPVQLLDLAPTLLQMAGAELPGGVWMQGKSLLARLRGSRPAAGGPGPLAYSEAGWEVRNHWQKIVRDRRFKLIYSESPAEQRWIGGRGVRFILYDLEHDPGETKNVAESFPADLERLKRDLWRWEKAPPFDTRVDVETDGCSDEDQGMDKQTEDLLRSLGYL